MKKGFDREALDVLVAAGVEDPVAIPSDTDQIGGAKLRQVLRDRRWASADMLGEVVDRMPTVQQRPHDPQPRRVANRVAPSFFRRVQWTSEFEAKASSDTRIEPLRSGRLRLEVEAPLTRPTAHRCGNLDEPWMLPVGCDAIDHGGALAQSIG